MAGQVMEVIPSNKEIAVKPSGEPVKQNKTNEQVKEEYIERFSQLMH